MDLFNINLSDFTAFFSYDFTKKGIYGLTILVIGYLVVKVFVIIIGKMAKHHLSPQSNMILKKIVTYTGVFFLLVFALQQFGLKMSALLGAAGILGVALGFASQTSVSNIISGLFLIGEKPFAVGDLVQIGDKEGIILSIDLLSIKLRTFNNKYIRIPNENIIKTEVINITKFPIRRLDIILGVSYKENITRVLEVLKDIADKNPLVLDEPPPFIIFKEFGDSSLNIKFGVWVTREQYFDLKKKIMIEIKERFDNEGIEIPFPHRTIYTGTVTEPFPVHVVKERN
jgi:small-conductance mechanosensitive channel